MEDAFEASGLSSILDFCFEFTGIHVTMLNTYRIEGSRILKVMPIVNTL